jgi:hypothetical protein
MLFFHNYGPHQNNLISEGQTHRRLWHEITLFFLTFPLQIFPINYFISFFLYLMLTLSVVNLAFGPVQVKAKTIKLMCFASPLKEHYMWIKILSDIWLLFRLFSVLSCKINLNNKTKYEFIFSLFILLSMYSQPYRGHRGHDWFSWIYYYLCNIQMSDNILIHI